MRIDKAAFFGTILGHVDITHAKLIQEFKLQLQASTLFLVQTCSSFCTSLVIRFTIWPVVVCDKADWLSRSTWRYKGKQSVKNYYRSNPQSLFKNKKGNKVKEVSQYLHWVLILFEQPAKISPPNQQQSWRRRKWPPFPAPHQKKCLYFQQIFP